MVEQEMNALYKQRKEMLHQSIIIIIYRIQIRNQLLSLYLDSSHVYNLSILYYYNQTWV